MPASEKLEPIKTMFFLGAGASIEAGLPTIKELTDKFLKEPKKHGAWLNTKESNEERIKDSLNIISDITRDYFHGKMDLELMMSLILRLQDKKDREGARPRDGITVVHSNHINVNMDFMVVFL